MVIGGGPFLPVVIEINRRVPPQGMAPVIVELQQEFALLFRQVRVFKINLIPFLHLLVFQLSGFLEFGRSL
jgi:hypothetical protein